MLWKSGNIELRIWPLDHCPSHVTAVCRPDAWTARFEFSMVEDAVLLMDVKPLRNAPTLSVLNGLAKQVHDNRLMCRTSWWQIQRTVCLDNAPVQKQQKTDEVLLLPAGSVYGGRASTKSWDAAGFATFLASNYRLRICCVRQFQNRIEESVYTLIKHQIERFVTASWTVVWPTTSPPAT